jgi:hypothetical protein
MFQEHKITHNTDTLNRHFLAYLPSEQARRTQSMHIKAIQKKNEEKVQREELGTDG